MGCGLTVLMLLRLAVNAPLLSQPVLKPVHEELPLAILLCRVVPPGALQHSGGGLAEVRVHTVDLAHHTHGLRVERLRVQSAKQCHRVGGCERPEAIQRQKEAMHLNRGSGRVHQRLDGLTQLHSM